jgi:hypothetical protein
LIRIPRRVWASSLSTLRECGGRNQRECVVFWLELTNKPGSIVAAVHPAHTATVGHYEVDQQWLHECWVQLRERHRSIAAQVHIHAGRAFHSFSDDEGPVVHVPGFLSLVLPSFALDDDCLEAAYLAELDASGSFRQAAIADTLAVI